jgi:hypothetical protein
MWGKEGKKLPPLFPLSFPDEKRRRKKGYIPPLPNKKRGERGAIF